MVRSALQALAYSGLLEIKRNRGTTFAKPAVGDTHEVFEARALIEPEVARRAAANISAADLTRLKTRVRAETSLAEALAGGVGGAAFIPGFGNIRFEPE